LTRHRAAVATPAFCARVRRHTATMQRLEARLEALLERYKKISYTADALRQRVASRNGFRFRLNLVALLWVWWFDATIMSPVVRYCVAAIWPAPTVPEEDTGYRILPAIGTIATYALWLAVNFAHHWFVVALWKGRKIARREDALRIIVQWYSQFAFEMSLPIPDMSREDVYTFIRIGTPTQGQTPTTYLYACLLGEVGFPAAEYCNSETMPHARYAYLENRVGPPRSYGTYAHSWRVMKFASRVLKAIAVARRLAMTNDPVLAALHRRIPISELVASAFERYVHRHEMYAYKWDEWPPGFWDETIRYWTALVAGDEEVLQYVASRMHPDSIYGECCGKLREYVRDKRHRNALPAYGL
jgi:hypothetical protein